MSHENVHVVVVVCSVFRAVLLIFSMFNCIGACIISFGVAHGGSSFMHYGSFAQHQSFPIARHVFNPNATGLVSHFLVEDLLW